MNETTALTVSEQSQLAELEVIIDKGLNTFYEVGKALSIIRESRLYRAEHATFEDYCEQRWGMSRAYAYRTIGAADVVKSLSPIGDIPLPANEAQARPLTSLEPEQRQQAWTKAVEESGGKPTARQVQQAADEVSGKVRNLAEGIRANVNAAAYEAIRSLQSSVLFWARNHWPALETILVIEKQIELLDAMKQDHKHVRWTDLSTYLVRQGKVFRVNDLRQALNNALDGLRQRLAQTQPTISQPSEPAQEQEVHLALPLVDYVEGFILAYKDPFGRETLDISNPSHTNGTFWDAITAAFARDSVVYKTESDLKIAIKQAYARLQMEAQIVKDGGVPVRQQAQPTGEHWAKSNPMSFWLEVDRLGVSRTQVLDFLQPGARSVTELTMTKEEAFARLVDAPRRVDPYDPSRLANGEPIADVLNSEQPTPIAAALVEELPVRQFIRVCGEIAPTLRKELMQEFSWWGEDDRKKVTTVDVTRRDFYLARSKLMLALSGLLAEC